MQNMDDDRTIEEVPEFPILALRTLFTLSWLAITVIFTFSSETEYTPPVAYPICGPVLGIEGTVEDQSLHIYYGIPYVRPALLQNRFRKVSVMTNPWPFLLDARDMPRPCPQLSRNVGKLTIDNSNSSEDCLYLNIYVPSRKVAERDVAFPIIIIVHGGGYYSGSNSFPFYDGKYIAAYGKAMVVVPNYRLGIFGFFSSSTGDAPGNQGLSDVYFALRWVKNNAAAFGGNTSTVTLLGHDVGSALIGLLNTIPGASDLFQRVIMLSGSPYMRYLQNRGRDTVQEKKNLLDHLGCSNVAKPLECMRGKPQKEIMDLVSRVAQWQTMYVPLQFENLQVDPGTALEKIPIKKDMLIGTTENGGAYFANFFLELHSVYDVTSLDRESIRAHMKTAIEMLGIRNADIILEHYDSSLSKAAQPMSVFAQAMSDIILNCPMSRFARDSVGENQVYVYVFNLNPRYRTADTAGYPDDVYFFVGFTLGAPTTVLTTTANEKALTKELIKSLVSFAVTGVPGEINNITWPRFTKEENSHLYIGDHVTPALRYREKTCQKLREALFSRE
ncbi:acetylcholinesterase-like [Ornithodoros turicata]|uniref:acetylcholinesterase-like n=1 Tax=Ornithodoros turicata TaxID=34597 RepID=UPI003139989F